jgi:hypothetical protein
MQHVSLSADCEQNTSLSLVEAIIHRFSGFGAAVGDDEGNMSPLAHLETSSNEVPLEWKIDLPAHSHTRICWSTRMGSALRIPR